MFRKIDDFVKAWDYETEATIKVLNALTDESLTHKVSDDGRTLGFLAWHMTQTLGEMPGLVGLVVFYLIAHQGHHRGQMTVLMRQAGLVVPGIYGPSREEWAAFGAPAMP